MSPVSVLESPPKSGSVVPSVPGVILRQVEALQRPILARLAESNGMSLDDYVSAVRDRIRGTVEGSRVMMRVPPEIVPHVFEDRRFRNLFEIEQHWHPIAASEGYHEWRVIGEELMFGISPDAPPSARPYYGTVGTTQGPASRYGLVMFVLRDSVRERATVTFGCTYVLGMGWAYAPSPLTAPTERSLWLAEPKNALFGDDWYVHPDPLRVPEDTVALARGGTPVAQIFGGISLDDVETIIFPGPPDKELREYADSLGIPWQVEEGS